MQTHISAVRERAGDTRPRRAGCAPRRCWQSCWIPLHFGVSPKNSMVRFWGLLVHLLVALPVPAGAAAGDLPPGGCQVGCVCWFLVNLEVAARVLAASSWVSLPCCPSCVTREASCWRQSLRFGGRLFQQPEEGICFGSPSVSATDFLRDPGQVALFGS